MLIYLVPLCRTYLLLSTCVIFSPSPVRTSGASRDLHSYARPPPPRLNNALSPPRGHSRERRRSRVWLLIELLRLLALASVTVIPVNAIGVIYKNICSAMLNLLHDNWSTFIKLLMQTMKAPGGVLYVHESALTDRFNEDIYKGKLADQLLVFTNVCLKLCGLKSRVYAGFVLPTFVFGWRENSQNLLWDVFGSSCFASGCAWQRRSSPLHVSTDEQRVWLCRVNQILPVWRWRHGLELLLAAHSLALFPQR